MNNGPWHPIKTFANADGKREVSIMVRNEGIFCYFESEWRKAYGETTESFFETQSGYYATAEEAERAAYEMVPWLKECG